MSRKMIEFSKLGYQQLKDFRNRYDAYIFDYNGCLIQRKGGIISGVNEALEEIAKNGKSIHVLSDNCLYTSKDIATNINKQFPVVKKENIISSVSLAVKYLKEINFKKKVYVIGYEHGIVKELRDCGFQVLYETEIKRISVNDLLTAEFEKDVGAVVIAGDINLNFFKLFKAANYLANPEVLLLQTHLSDFLSYDPVIPGVGALTLALKAGSGRKETIGLGKSSDFCTKYLKSLGYPAERCLIIGDDVASDIVAGNKAGIDTMLTISLGMCNLKHVEAAKAENLEQQIPTYYTNTVADLIKAFKN